MNNAVDLLKSACKGGATEKAGLENATMPNAESQDALSYLQAAYVSIFKTAFSSAPQTLVSKSSRQLML